MLSLPSWGALPGGEAEPEEPAVPGDSFRPWPEPCARSCVSILTARATTGHLGLCGGYVQGTDFWHLIFLIKNIFFLIQNRLLLSENTSRRKHKHTPNSAYSATYTNKLCYLFKSFSLREYLCTTKISACPVNNRLVLPVAISSTSFHLTRLASARSLQWHHLRPDCIMARNLVLGVRLPSANPGYWLSDLVA